MTTRLYLIRHAEAEGNRYRIAHGHYNSTVTPRGYRQLAALRQRFRDVEIDNSGTVEDTAAAIWREFCEHSGT